MKRILSLMVAAMLTTLTACGGQTQNPAANTPPSDTHPVTQPVNPAEPTELPEQEGETPQAEHILIAYFFLWDNAPWDEDTDTNTSASVVVDESGAAGTNAYVARMIQEETGGNLHAIITTEPYPADFDAVVAENHSESSRSISSAVEDMEQYDTVFIGYPVWATTLPQAVRTFLTEYDFSGKTVIPFCTHDGYGAGSSYSTIGRSSTGATVEQGLAVDSSRVSSAQSTVTDWLSGLNLPAAGGGNSQPAQGEAAIRITIGDTKLEGVLYNSDMARQFTPSFPRPSP